jgi:hypothetical protein
MSLLETLTADLTVAMKSGDKARVETLRGLKSDIKYKEIEKKQPLTEEEVTAALSAAAKRRRDSIEQFKLGNREDLVAKESAELEMITAYLPQQMAADKLDEIISVVIAETGATSAADLGRVMKEIMPRVKGRADGNLVRQMIATKLSG